LRDGSPNDVAVISAGGRPHPVEVRWFPRKPNEKLEPSVVSTIRTALRRESGDVLVFLPGAGEITRVATLLESAGLPAEGVDIRPLYGMLGADEQDAALMPSPSGRRRVVLATDIAESSLTVEGVRIVIDSGLARAPRFDPSTGLTRLRIVSVSKASTEQRAGRAGRQGPGTVYRLWSKGEHAARRAHHEPEITQVDLAGLVLELAMWGSQAATLPFLDQPPERTLTDAIELLSALGAIDDDQRLTDLGRRMNNLPLHPRLARMVTVAAGVGSHEGALACALAVLLDERDVLRGRPDELPTDVTLRLSLLADPQMRHPAGDGRALSASRHRLRDLLQRASVPADLADVPERWRNERAGSILALAYPDRLAVRRGGQPGRFQLRSGAAAWVPKGDVLANEPFLVVPDLDGDRREARIRMAASIDPVDVGRLFGEELDTRASVVWDRQRDELVERLERRLGNVVLEETTRRPEPSEEVVGLLLERVRERGLDASFGWNDASRAVLARVSFCHRIIGEPWPDWSPETLLANLEIWLAPFLMFATGRSDLEAIDPAATLLAGLDPRIAYELDRVAPTHLTMPSGRRAIIDYDDASGTPVLAVRVQDVFGLSATPTIANGRVPLLLHLLSPAGRPVQITSDLAGFWTGSYREVRKEMAGRYPKHRWPENPTAPPPPTQK
jgi:ATP-dependent helicase HrpB